jgi:thioesterase domain-containing protein
MLENKGVVNQLFSKIDLLKLDTDAVICHNSQLHFVGGIWQLWAPLLRGGKVILCNEEELRSVGRLLHKAAVSGATMLEIIPSQLNEHLFSEKRIDLTGLSTLILTGEKLNTHFVGKCYAGNPHVEIINTYGQTECSDVTTFYKIPRVSDSGSVLIGRPIQNTEIYILSADGILCPVGVVGEICTGGDGVSRGYLNKSKLTAEKFVDNPFKKGERMYKTGDLGRWLFDGTIEIIGRKDDQVKIRGYRIEIEEIQQALLQYEVEEAVLLFSDDTKKLVAYIVSKDRLNVNDIRTFLSKRIPGYMIPAQYVQVEQIPLLPNGKIDKKALLRMESNSMDTGIEYVEPRNEVEIRIREIWSAVLQKGKIGIHDDFFALGGHSLLLIQLVNKMNAAFEKAGIRLVDLIKSTTIEQLGTVIRTRQDGLEPLASSSHRDNPYIIKLREGEDGTPTFIIPGMPGVSDGYIDLARGIRTPGVVYGLQMRGLLGEDPLNSIEKMAVHNISLIRAVGPVQSINLYAHSYGGTVVYEMLRQLNGTGITVKELVLIECFPMRDERHSAGESRRGPGESRRGPGELRRVPDVEDSGISDVGSRVTDEEMLYSFVYSVLLKDAQVMPDEALREILRRPKQEWTKRLYDLLKKGGLEINELVFMRLWTLYEQSLSVHYTYPGQLARRVTLVLADDQANQQTYADWMRWADYFQHVDVLHSPGDHFSIVKEPYCGEWLARLSY